MFLSDFFDCWSTRFIGKIAGVEGEYKKCKNFHYQLYDKIVDLLTNFLILY
uniref:Uncharacterized protein n=1 Tax=viral metagenome TaxID=1070528 RepID=A0A6C0EB80_9ZZZZ